MSQDQTCPGFVASSSGTVRGGWLACERRSPEAWFALDFYVGVLGMEKTADIDLGFMRWITVSVPGAETPGLVLCPLSLAGLDAERQSQAEKLLADGVLGGIFLDADDVHATYTQLVAAGAHSVQPPTQQPYGTDCAFRDPFGNQIRINERVPAEALDNAEAASI
jgi:predicted enzyme related to lactoylglutathione lyase